MMALYLDLIDIAGAEISAALEYTRNAFGDNAAETFAERVAQAFAQEVERLAEEITANTTGKAWQPIDEAASVKWSQPVYKLRVETGARRRRGSSTGLWYAYYTLVDASDAGAPDTMQVLAFRHSAARPIGTDSDTGTNSFVPLDR